jgi:hypothetical protein
MKKNLHTTVIYAGRPPKNSFEKDLLAYLQTIDRQSTARLELTQRQVLEKIEQITARHGAEPTQASWRELPDGDWLLHWTKAIAMLKLRRSTYLEGL